MRLEGLGPWRGPCLGKGGGFSGFSSVLGFQEGFGARAQGLGLWFRACEVRVRFRDEVQGLGFIGFESSGFGVWCFTKSEVL